MTKEDKRRAIDDYCYNTGGCEKCKLYRAIPTYESCYEDEDADIERNYAIIFGDEGHYWTKIDALAKRQREKGMSKYGQGLEDNPSDIIKRIEHLEQRIAKLKERKNMK